MVLLKSKYGVRILISFSKLKNEKILIKSKKRDIFSCQKEKNKYNETCLEKDRDISVSNK